jgi:hypothetical protein
MSSARDKLNQEYNINEIHENEEKKLGPELPIWLEILYRHKGQDIVRKNGRIMDPFEARLSFTKHLQHLNASQTSANKAAQYALKYRDMDEDLHSCILEQLEKVRVGFFFFYKFF